MKTIKLIMLLSVLCFFGCSKEEPKTVSFSAEEMHVENKGRTFPIRVQANCSWRIYSITGEITANPSSGEGAEIVSITVPKNDKYEELVFSVILESQDRTANDELTVIQQPLYGLTIQSINTLDCEGGEFEIKANTNDNITSINTPDWITFISSRTLPERTFKFSVDANYEGEIRKGELVFKGRNLTEKIEITQDSYTPTQVEMHKDISIVSDKTINSDLSIVPEYADWSKLCVVSSDGCEASITDKRLAISVDKYGEYNIKFTGDGEELLNKNFEYVPKHPFMSESPTFAYKGQINSFVNWEYYSSLYELKSSNPSVIRIVDGKNFEAVGIGTSVISAGIPNTDIQSSREVTVDHFILKAQIGWMGNNYDDSFNVSFTARATGPSGLTFQGFKITDPTGRIIINNTGTITGDKIITSTIRVMVDYSLYFDIFEALGSLQFTAKAMIKGQTYEKTVPINSYAIGSL